MRLNTEVLVDYFRKLLNTCVINLMHDHALYDDTHFYPLQKKLEEMTADRDRWQKDSGLKETQWGTLVGELRAKVADLQAFKDEFDSRGGKGSGFWKERCLAAEASLKAAAPIPMVLYCPDKHQHIDEDDWATKPHRTHKCQHEVIADCGCGMGEACELATREVCGLEWRPANVPTVGVKSL